MNERSHDVAPIHRWVDDAVARTPIFDLHTHLVPPQFGSLMLFGIDELLTYHYLIAEMLRARPDVAYNQFWTMAKPAQADLVWSTLFVERPPISEACRGVITVLKAIGFEPSATLRLEDARSYYRERSSQRVLDDSLAAAGVRSLVMTNDPFDATERPVWERRVDIDRRFKAALRIDPLLVGWPDVAERLTAMGYHTSGDLSATSLTEVRRFLTDWIRKLKPIYVAASLPPTWRYPDTGSATSRILDEVIIPVCREHRLPIALMIGVTRQVNPSLRQAGDSLAQADVPSLERLLAAHADNRFMVTFLSRENQHALAVAARKFRNLLPFGCWWFLNNPSLISEITTMRTELLGTTFVPQHSDARVTEQLIYKWLHSRATIKASLKSTFDNLAASGWAVTQSEVQRVIDGYFQSNAQSFLDPETW